MRQLHPKCLLAFPSPSRYSRSPLKNTTTENRKVNAERMRFSSWLSCPDVNLAWGKLLQRRRIVLDERRHDVLLSQSDGVVGGRHMGARIRVRELHREVIHQRHSKILPLGRTHAGDMEGEILSRHALVIVPAIFLTQAIPVGVASRPRPPVRIFDLAGHCD